jgi:monoamine oxidase
MRENSFVDLVIVGAGAAGIGAGRAARALGLRVLIVEAMSRIGGRAWTDTHSIGLPWDHGCHWLHSGSRNPLVPLAEQLGIVYEQPDDDVSYFHGRWADASERAGLVRHFYDVIARGAEVGATADRPLSEVMPRGTPWDAVVESWLIHAFAHPAELIATGDIARYEADSTSEDWPVRDGYGTLFARLAADLPIVCNAPVSRIDWNGRAVRVVTNQGTVEAQAAIITASTNVLADEVIRFDPPLPLWKREAWAAAPLGAANKIAIRFTRDVLKGDAPNRFAFTTSGDGTAYWLRPFDQPVAIALLGGSLCRDLARQGRAACLDYVREQLIGMFGSDIASAIGAVGYALWTEEPYIRGSYAGCLPGQAHRREDLAHPIGERLFFAGEATAPTHFATAHGAYQSGIAAVEGLPAR